MRRGTTVTLSDLLEGDHGVILVFYRGFLLRNLPQSARGAARSHPPLRRGRDIGRSPSALTMSKEPRRWPNTRELTTRILADPDHAVAESYGVFDLLNDGVSAPAVLLIGEHRVVHWRHVAEGIGDRPSINKILDAILEVEGTEPGA